MTNQEREEKEIFGSWCKERGGSRYGEMDILKYNIDYI